MLTPLGKQRGDIGECPAFGVKVTQNYLKVLSNDYFTLLQYITWKDSQLKVSHQRLGARSSVAVFAQHVQKQSPIPQTTKIHPSPQYLPDSMLQFGPSSESALCCISNNRNPLLWFQRLRNARSRCWKVQCLVRVCTQVLHGAKKDRQASVSYKGNNVIREYSS